MTYDELVQKVEALDYIISPNGSGDKAVYALRAVVEIHKPFPSGVCGCELDAPLSYTYPCMTIQAIEAEIE